MNIDRISVKGLFNHFDYELSFIDENRIMLLAGPNGSGKTTILKLIDLVFNLSFNQLAEAPFHELKFFFDNDSKQLLVQRILTKTHDDAELPLSFTLREDNTCKKFNPSKIKSSMRRNQLSLSMIEDLIPELQRVGQKQWITEDTRYILELEDVITNYIKVFPDNIQKEINSVPDWLYDISRSINVRFIDTERLTCKSLEKNHRHRTANSTMLTVTYYSRLLSNQIQVSISKYGSLSQSLDRSFPSRVVTNDLHSTTSIEELKKDLNDIKQKRQRLEDAGLLSKDHHDLQIPDLGGADDSQRNVLSVYAKDTNKKLAVFDDLYEKITVFKKIVNHRFSHKHVYISDQGFFVSQNGDTSLNLELLSSGEQHELVFLYDLLFRASKNSLVLIDEPEISLHVAWQRKWLEDLNSIAELSKFRSIVATHSPQIIGDSWHLVVQLISGNKVHGT
ncbi:MAG: AAA family ATPase [Bacteroidetes bacterium]|nr:AAA family ATPase [Bacteroidota bacterium]